MGFHSSGADTRAVSPVVGTVLVVAIVVVLSSVVGAMALGFGDRTVAPPQAQFTFDPVWLTGQPDELSVRHAGGDSVPNTELYVTANVEVQDEDGSDQSDRLQWYTAAADSGGGPEGASVTTGDSVLVEPPDADGSLADKTFRVVWASDGQSVTLATWEGPAV